MNQRTATNSMFIALTAHPSGPCRAIGCVQGIWRGDAMAELPRSLPEFEARFPDDAACARWLLAKRWPDGFRCPACGHTKGWELGRERLALQCAACERQVSVTAGTVLHGSHLGLRTWFLAAWLMATHANGISARQLWKQLGLGSYKSAWLLLRKLRRAMVDPEREPLAGLVEVEAGAGARRAATRRELNERATVTDTDEASRKRSERARRAAATKGQEGRRAATLKGVATKGPEVRRQAALKALATRGVESLREAGRKAAADRDPEAHRAAIRKALAAKSPEARADAARKRAETRRRNREAAKGEEPG